MGKTPRISGRKLIRLLKKDGWEIVRHSLHGKFMVKGNRHTVVQDTPDPLPIGTLKEILGPTQTGLGRVGLERLMRKHG